VVNPVVAKSGTLAPAQTFAEPQYLRALIERKAPVCVKLIDGKEYRGYIEYYDASFIRLTRTPGANLFIFKHDIRYLYEESPAR
jgi:host factor-I protein